MTVSRLSVARAATSTGSEGTVVLIRMGEERREMRGGEGRNEREGEGSAHK